MSRIKTISKTLAKYVVLWLLIIQTIVLIILYNLGFRITYGPELETSWDAISAMGQWAGVLVGFLIPIAAVYLQAQIEKNKKEIGESNSELYNEFIEFKTKYADKLKELSKLVDENGKIIIDGGSFTDNNRAALKDKALKFINISMVTSTKRVADHLEISEEEAFGLLEEMLRHDESISAGGQIRKENIENIVWTKKRKR